MRQNMPGWWWLVLVLQMLEPLLTHGRPTQPIWKRSSVQYQYRDRREQCDIWLDNSTTAMLDAWTALVVLWKVDTVRWSLNNVALKALPKHCTVQLMEQAKGGGKITKLQIEHWLYATHWKCEKSSARCRIWLCDLWIKSLTLCQLK